MTAITGDGRADKLAGKDDADDVRGNGGNDDLTGNGGNDRMWGGGGSDKMLGGLGDDLMVGGTGASMKTHLNHFAISEDAKGKITFDGESAGYKNTLGLYKIGADGKIYGAEIVFANASLKGSGGDLVAGKSTFEFDLKAGERIGFFVVPNAYDKAGMAKLFSQTDGEWKIVDAKTGEPATINGGPTKLVHVGADGKQVDVKSQYGVDMFHSVSTSLNGDKFEHVKGQGDALDGTVKIGFEDLWGGGDKDFDDSVFTVDIGVGNVTKLAQAAGKVAQWKDHDDMDGGVGNDKMLGGSGNDTMNGGVGNDKLSGGSGNDVMTGGDGNDLVMGNAGDDLLLADAGDDLLYGGSGFDTVDFSAAQTGLAVDLNAHIATGMGRDWIEGVERVVGSDFDDTIGGDKRGNALEGGAGDDILRGRGGADALTGGKGDDTFVWHAKDLGALDVVTDFSIGDTLDLSRVFKGLDGNHRELVSITDGKDGLIVSVHLGDKMVDVALLKGLHDTEAITADMLLV